MFSEGNLFTKDTFQWHL